MSRAFILPGETLITVRGGAHMSGGTIGGVYELGLSSDAIVVAPSFSYEDVKVDDFGPNVPADLQWMLSEVRIRAALIHYDKEVLEVMQDESMGGAGFVPIGNGLLDQKPGCMAPAGMLMGGRKAMYASGNHFFSFTLHNSDLGSGTPWRFRKCVLAENPAIYRLGTNASLVDVTVRAIPYWSPTTTTTASGGGSSLTTLNREIQSSGAILWDFQEDSVD